MIGFIKRLFGNKAAASTPQTPALMTWWIKFTASTDVRAYDHNGTPQPFAVHISGDGGEMIIFYTEESFRTLVMGGVDMLARYREERYSRRLNLMPQDNRKAEEIHRRAAGQ